MNDENKNNASIGAAIGIAAALAAQKIAENSGENNPEKIAENAAIIASELLHEEVTTSKKEVMAFIENEPEIQPVQPVEETKPIEDKTVEQKQTRQTKKKTSTVATVVETIKDTKENKEESKTKDDSKPKKLTRAQAEEKAKEEQTKSNEESKPSSTKKPAKKAPVKKTTRKTSTKTTTKENRPSVEKETAENTTKPKQPKKTAGAKDSQKPQTKDSSTTKKTETTVIPETGKKEPATENSTNNKNIESVNVLDIKPEDTEIEEGKILKDGVEVIAPVETVNEVIDNIVETMNSEEEGTAKSFTAEFMAVESIEDEKPTVDFIESLYNDDDDDYKSIMASSITDVIDMSTTPQKDQKTDQYHEYTFGQTGAILDLDQVDHEAFKAGREAHSSSAKQCQKANNENDTIVNEIKQEADKRRKAFADRINEITKKR